MGLIFEKKVDGPGAHAIVIGVGYYKHLLGGDPRQLFPNHEGLGQLSSPPYSARVFTDWLLNKYNNPEAELSSVELLISDNTDHTYKPSSGETRKVDRARKAAVRDAIRRWKARGDEREDNLAIFYFCGHGASSGPSTTLLLEDFGESHDSPFENSIDFSSFHLGMDKCSARKQVFFIDACRLASSELVENYAYKGDPIITASVHQRKRDAPVFYSTGLGEGAYAEPNEPSVFTDALIRALNGAGSNNLSGAWRVSTTGLHLGLTELMDRLYSDEIEQSCRADNNSRLLLHQIDGSPVVPVLVSCDPKTANDSAQLSYSRSDGSNEVVRESPAPSDWIIDVESGSYLFNARFATNQYHSNSKSREVTPPVTTVPIEVY